MGFTLAAPCSCPCHHRAMGFLHMIPCCGDDGTTAPAIDTSGTDLIVFGERWFIVRNVPNGELAPPPEVDENQAPEA